LEEARDKVCWGRERRSHVLDEDEKRLTACHEAGHAITMHCTDGTEPLHKVTIIPRGRALGATMQLPEKDRYTNSQKWLEGMLIGMMGGRAAEELVFGDVTTGAQNDLMQATRIARAMVCEYGMSPVLGPQNFGSNQELLFLGREVNRTQTISEETARKIDAEVNRILREAHERALQILREKQDRLTMLTALLIEHETLDGRQVEAIIDHGQAPELQGAAENKPEPAPETAPEESDAPDAGDAAEPESEPQPVPAEPTEADGPEKE
jgi:cell division protease FtsH